MRCVDQEVHADVIIADFHDVLDPLEESLIRFLNDQQIKITRLGNVPRRKRTEQNYLFRFVVLFESDQDSLQGLFKLFQTLFVRRQTYPNYNKVAGSAPFPRTTSVRVVGKTPKPEELL